VSTKTQSIYSTSPFATAYNRIIAWQDGVPADFEFLDANTAFGELIGRKTEDLPGRKASETLSASAIYNTDALQLYGQVVAEDSRGSFEFHSAKRGRWYEVHAWAGLDDDCFAIQLVDITDKKSLEVKHQERKKELKVVYDMARISEREDTSIEGICQALADHLPAAFQLPEQTSCLITIGDHEYRSYNYQPSDWILSRRISVSGSQIGTITVCISRNCTENGVNPFLQEEKQLLDVVADWTGQFIRRKQSELRLLEANTIINRSATVVFTWENAPGWPVTYVSDNVKTILGYNPQEFLSGKIKYRDCIHRDDAERIAKEIEFHNKTGKNEYVHEPYRVITRGGEVKWVYDWTFIVRDDNGNITHFKGFIHDITSHKLAQDALKESEYLLKKASEMVLFGGWSVDLNQNIVYWSDMVAKIHEEPPGYSPSVEEGISYYAPEWRDRITKVFKDCAETGHSYDEELEIITAKGNRRWVRTTGEPVRNTQGNIYKIQGAFQDITERKKAEQKLRESEERFRKIFEIASLGIAQVNPSTGDIQLVNKYYEEITGYTVEELLTKKFPELTHPDDRAADWDIFQRAARGEISYRNEKRYIRKDGAIVWVRLHVAFIRDEAGRPVRTVAICENITERKRADEQLKKSLEEKTTLLQELYHRTKNNMQVISSMLMIHSLRSDDDTFKVLAHDINNRIKSMSLVHQKLYESNNLSYIPFEEYIRDLFTELGSSYLVRPGMITLNLDTGSLKLLIDTAIPCGLVLNELISNSIKHAFPEDREGTITIRATKCKDQNIHIQYSDDGVGLPAGFDPGKDGGMGWELLRMIVEYQLGGTITCRNNGGMICDVLFTDNKYSERVKE